MTDLILVVLLLCFIVGGVLWLRWPRRSGRPLPGDAINIYQAPEGAEMPNATVGSLCIVGSPERSSLYVMTKKGWAPLATYGDQK